MLKTCFRKPQTTKHGVRFKFYHKALTQQLPYFEVPFFPQLMAVFFCWEANEIIYWNLTKTWEGGGKI